MSLADELRAYADNALNAAISQGKQALDQAQTQTAEAAHELRSAAERTVEPYVARVLEYTHELTELADALATGLRSDDRVARLLGPADPLFGAVVGFVQERVLRPMRAYTASAEPASPRPEPEREAPVSETPPDEAPQRPTAKKAAKTAAPRPAPVPEKAAAKKAPAPPAKKAAADAADQPTD